MFRGILSSDRPYLYYQRVSVYRPRALSMQINLDPYKIFDPNFCGTKKIFPAVKNLRS